MKKLLYIVTLFFFVFNTFAGRAVLPEGEIIVLDTTASDVMPMQKNNVTTHDSQSVMPENSSTTNIDRTDSMTEENVATTDTMSEIQTGFSQGSVSRSVFTTDISGHEPVDKIENLNSNNRSVVYFTELRNMSGQTAIHRWEFNGNVMAETKFKIAGPRWRVWSSKNLLPSWTGEWKVSVLNGVGEVISEDVFNYIEEDIVDAGSQQSSMTDAPIAESNSESNGTNDNLN